MQLSRTKKVELQSCGFLWFSFVVKVVQVFNFLYQSGNSYDTQSDLDSTGKYFQFTKFYGHIASWNIWRISSSRQTHYNCFLVSLIYYKFCSFFVTDWILMSPKQLASIIQFQEPSCRTDCDLRSYIELHLVQEPATKVFYKNFILKILQNSQENTCVRVSFLLQFLIRPKTYLNGGSGIGVSLWILQNL